MRVQGSGKNVAVDRGVSGLTVGKISLAESGTSTFIEAKFTRRGWHYSNQLAVEGLAGSQAQRIELNQLFTRNSGAVILIIFYFQRS
jgi:hypothetical protein